MVIRVWEDCMMFESAIPKAPINKEDEESIVDTSYGFGLYVLAPNEQTAFMKAADRVKPSALQRAKEYQMKKPATMQDVENLRNEVISLKEFVERKHAQQTDPAE